MRFRTFKKLVDKLKERDREIKRLKKILEEIKNIAVNAPENADVSEFNDIIELILSLAKQALKEK